MNYGICNLSIVPIRAEASDKSEMISQMLFGEHFSIIEENKKWSKIKLFFDDYEGFIDNNQFEEISEDLFYKLSTRDHIYSGEIIDFISSSTNELITIPLGSRLPFLLTINFLSTPKDTSLTVIFFQENYLKMKLSKKHLRS